MRKIFLVVALSLAGLNLLAQGNNENTILPIVEKLQENIPGQGKIVINQDNTITQLHSLRYLQNAKSPGMDGFRIRIFFEIGQFARKNSEDVMQAFMEKYPGVPVYQSYQNPYWKISVGDFRSRESALKFYYEILKDYPKAFIIPERINFPSLE